MRAALGKFGSRVAGAVRSPLSLEARAAAFVVFVCVVLVLLDGWRTLHARTVQLHETVVHTENLARTLAEQADDTISSVDLVILGQVERVENDGTGAVQMDRLHRFLATRVAAMPALRALSVYGPDGELIVAAAPPEAGEGNIRDREDFSFLRSHVEDGAHISPARRIGTKGEWVITVSRRIVGPDGGFAGIVAADIALDYFQNYYRTIDLGDEGVVVLVLSSGQILARWPLAEASIGQGVPNRQALDSVRAGAVNGREARSSIDGIVRISSGRELDRYPVALFVGLGKNEVLAEWRRDALSNLVGLASLVLLIGLLGIPLTSAIRRRAAAERTAAAAAAELKLLADNATDMIIQADLAGGCGFVSPGSRHVLGREPEELTGTSIIDLIHPDDVGPTRRALVALITKGEYDTITHRLRHRDGHYVWIEAGLRLVRDPETGAPLEIVSVSRDISQRKEAEAHLLDAVESINDGFVLFDADWRFVMCNTRYREIYPKSGDFLVPGIKRRTLLMAMSARGEFGPVDDPERFIDTFLAQNAESGSIFERPLADGRWILGSDRRTSMGSWVGIRTDITEQKRREFDLTDTRERLEIQAVELVKTAEDLAALKDEAERANQVKSEFLAMMSHEIRTPMNGIIGMNGLLLSTRLAPEQHRFAEAVRMSAESLLTIINDILDVSKLEAGKIDLEIVDFNLAEIVEDAVALLSPRAQQKGLETAADVAPEAVGPFRGDPSRLRQIVLNLLSNAVKFTETGFVFVRVLTLAPEIGAAAPDGGTRVRIEVHDTGIGVTDAVKAKLFQPFQQADSSISRRFGGTGLGLNISRQLVELMGGRIGIADRLGGGSIFWLELTLPAGDSHLEEPVAPAEGLRGQRVLVVDDTEINRFILRRQLTANGMAVTEAEDGASALAALAEAEAMGRPFDVVVLDQVMPTLSGELVAETIRERSDWHQPKLVLLSSAGQPTRSGNLGERGFDAVLVKPMRQQALVECLARLAAPPGHPDAFDETLEDEAPPPRSRGGRILLAEDNLINREVAIAILEGFGFTVDVAFDGQEAIDAVRRHRYDLVLMDVQMPRLDGLEATRRLRAEVPEAESLPIIAMTANAMSGDRKRCLEAGMDDYVSKPIEPRALLATIERWLMLASFDDEAGAEDGEVPLSDAVVDEAYIADLQRMLPPDRFASLLRSYVEGAERRWGRIAAYAAARDLAGLRREAHDLISTAGNLGARRLQSLGGSLQAACKAGDEAQAMRLVEEIRRASPEASARFKEALVGAVP